MRFSIYFAASLATICITLGGGNRLHASTATFEDITLPASGYDNGSGGSGAFFSDGLKFNNSYNSNWGSWSDWAISKTTDTTTAGLTNQYSAYTGSGDGSSQYGVVYGNTASIIAPVDETFKSMRITNTTYAALSMQEGDSFAKKYGGTSGDDKDWFKLTISGSKGGSDVGTIDFYLADYRFVDNTKDYIVDAWTTIDLTSLVGAEQLKFSFSSSDNGAFGMNTPAYFAADNIVTAESVPEPSAAILLLIGSLFSIKRHRRN